MLKIDYFLFYLFSKKIIYLVSVVQLKTIMIFECTAKNIS